MKVLFVTDPLPGLAADVDASVGMMSAAADLGVEVWACGPEELSVTDGRVRARATRISLRPRRRGRDHRWLVEPTWWDVLGTTDLDVADETALVMLRIDPPVDARYLHTTYLLDLVVAAGVRVVNDPAGVRALHEKVVALHLPHLAPRTLVTADPAQVRAFVADVGTVVLKPVDGFAGTDVWLLRDDPAARALAASATLAGRRHVIAQEFLAAVEHGNKRIFLVDGEPCGAVLRRPERDDFRIGPPVAPADLDDGDRAVVAAVAPLLARHGITVAGLDVIDGRLIEVNVTCPGGQAKYDALLGTDLCGDTVRRLLHHERTPA